MDDPQLKILLAHYHNGTATPEELRQLQDWYQGLQQTQESFFAGEVTRGTALPRLLERVHAQLQLQPHVRKLWQPRQWMSAAAVLLLMAAGIGWFRYAPYHQAARPLASVSPVIPATPIVHWEQQQNTTHATSTRVLPDGSLAKLAPGAILRYQQPFIAASSRAVYIEGQVFFDVAKDKAHPFTVYSGMLATTALGTSFSVAETKAGARIVLFTGKVVVKPVHQLKGWQNDVFLLPGEQLQYNTALAQVAVIKTTTPAAAIDEPLVFEDRPLAEVIEKLSKRYHVAISYRQEDLAGMHFSGSVRQTDSLSVLLRAIAQMNGLTITPEARGFVVQPSP